MHAVRVLSFRVGVNLNLLPYPNDALGVGLSQASGLFSPASSKDSGSPEHGDGHADGHGGTAGVPLSSAMATATTAFTVDWRLASDGVQQHRDGGVRIMADVVKGSAASTTSTAMAAAMHHRVGSEGVDRIGFCDTCVFARLVQWTREDNAACLGAPVTLVPEKGLSAAAVASKRTTTLLQRIEDVYTDKMAADEVPPLLHMFFFALRLCLVTKLFCGCA